MAQHFRPAIDHCNTLDAIDSALIKWLETRAFVWSGTAGELLRTLMVDSGVSSHVLPASPSALYNHLHNRQEILRSIGIDVAIMNGHPRMLCIRQCLKSLPEPTSLMKPDASQSLPSVVTPPQTDASETQTPVALRSTLSGLSLKPADRAVANAILTISEINGQIKKSRAQSDKILDPEHETSRIAGMARQSSPLFDLEGAGTAFQASNSSGDNELDTYPVFENITEAFLGVCEMEKQLANAGLGSSIQFIAEQTCELARADGVASGVIQDGKLAYCGQAGDVRERIELQCHSPVFQHCIRASELVHFTDVELVSLFGAELANACVKCLIALPFSIDKSSRGAIQVSFHKRRSFQPADIIVLQAITETVAAAIKDRRL